MLVGHGALAFCLVGTLATLVTDRPPKQRLRLAAVGFVFATLPDVDALFSIVTLLYAGFFPATVVDFWAIVNAFHRSSTHAFLVQSGAALVATGVAALAPPVRLARSVPGLLLAGGATAGTVGIVAVYGTPLEGVLVTIFLSAAAIAGYATVSLTRLSPRALGGAALVGLLSHSPGDLFWIPPPDLLYPVVSPSLTEPLQFHPWPTHNVAMIFLMEATIVLLGVLTYFYIVPVSPFDRLSVFSLAGVLVVPALRFVTLPTIETPYSYSALLFGLGSAVALIGLLRAPPGTRIETSVLSGVTCVFVSSLTYVLWLY